MPVPAILIAAAPYALPVALTGARVIVACAAVPLGMGLGRKVCQLLKLNGSPAVITVPAEPTALNPAPANDTTTDTPPPPPNTAVAVAR